MFVGGDIFDPFAKVWPNLQIKTDYIWTDNWIYLMHRKWSFIISCISLICITSYVAIIEEPIRCLGDSKDVAMSFLELFCWVWGTYTVPEYLNTTIGEDFDVNVPHPGIGREEVGKTTRMYHSHYVFYPIIILFQCCSFRFTKYFWQHLEGGRLKTLLSELSSPTVSVEKMNERIRLVTDYMTTYPVTFLNRYSFFFILCEVGNFINTILQFFFLNFIFRGEFLAYGVNAIKYVNQDPWDNYPSPFDRMFPKVTKCEFRKAGSSGTLEKKEFLCVMPLHNFAEKIFLVSWFWLIILGTISFLGLMYRAAVFTIPKCRFVILRLKTRGSLCESQWIRYFVNNSSYGAWFVVSMLHKNMSPWVFAHFMRELHDKMREVADKDF